MGSWLSSVSFSVPVLFSVSVLVGFSEIGVVSLSSFDSSAVTFDEEATGS